MPKYTSQYKSGSYNRKGSKYYSKALTTASNLYAIRQAKRAANAPLSNRGFGSMAILQNREKKFYDNSSARYNAKASDPVIKLLFVPVLGSDYNNRIGRKTVMKSLYIRGHLRLKAAANLDHATPCPAQQARLIIFCDMQPNGATPNLTDLLTGADATYQLNPNNRDRFKIIKDKLYSFDTYEVSTLNGWAQSGRTGYDIKIYKKLNMETIFNATNAGTIGDINTGALYMVWVGTVISNDSIPEAYVSTRVRFDDA